MPGWPLLRAARRKGTSVRSRDIPGVPQANKVFVLRWGVLPARGSTNQVPPLRGRALLRGDGAAEMRRRNVPGSGYERTGRERNRVSRVRSGTFPVTAGANRVRAMPQGEAPGFKRCKGVQSLRRKFVSAQAGGRAVQLLPQGRAQDQRHALRDVPRRNVQGIRRSIPRMPSM